MAATEPARRADKCALSRATRAVAFAVAALSCSVSLVLTVRLCLDLRSGVGGVGTGGSVAGDLLAVAIGVTWELAKVLFAAVGIGLLLSGRGSRRLAGLTLSLLATVLVSGSVVASMGFLSELDEQRTAARTAAATVLEDVETQLAALDHWHLARAPRASRGGY